MNASREFMSRLGLQCPIIQAPMAGVATPQLAAAVSNAGGMGSLGIGASSIDHARQLICDTHALTARPFNVNVFCHQPAQPDPARESAWLAHLAPLFAEFGAEPPVRLNEIYRTFLRDQDAFRLLLELKPAVVSFHFGLPEAEQIAALHDAGIYLLATATCLEEAQQIEQAGIDAIVAQGIEAGGHRGMFDPGADDQRLSTALLVRMLVQKTSLPVIAAGGIMDGRAVRAMLELGAAAAQLGTAFVPCPESAATDSYRENLRNGRAAFTRLTPALSGRPARGIVNRYIEFSDTAVSPPAAPYPFAYDAAKQLNALASRQGNHEFAAHWAGQGAPLAREMPAAQLLATMAREMGAC